MEAGERVNALGTKKLFPLIVSMSIPAICGNITTALYNVVDRLFVGQFVGRNALGAIGLMFPLNNVTSAITVLLTIGGGALISLSLGRKEKDKADEAFTNIVSMGAILAFIVTLFFFIFASQLICLCGHQHPDLMMQELKTLIMTSFVRMRQQNLMRQREIL